MSQFDFDDNDNDALSSTNFGQLNFNMNKKNNINSNAFDDFEKTTKNTKTFNPSNTISTNVSSNKHKPQRPVNNFNSNTFDDDGETPTPNKKTVMNPFMSNQSNNNNYNQGNQMNMTSNDSEDLHGFVNLNEESKPMFDPSKPYDPNEELPLLEELGINPQVIKEKMMSVVMVNKVNKQVLDNADMTGPLLIFIAFCFSLVLQKKTHFGYIYGTTLFGGFIINILMNLMSRKESILLYNTISVLGYCMIPIVFTSFVGLIIDLKAIVGLCMCIASIVMASYTASNFFEVVLQMNSQKWLIFYPLMLFYTSFLLVTMY